MRKYAAAIILAIVMALGASPAQAETVTTKTTGVRTYDRQATKCSFKRLDTRLRVACHGGKAVIRYRFRLAANASRIKYTVNHSTPTGAGTVTKSGYKSGSYYFVKVVVTKRKALTIRTVGLTYTKPDATVRLDFPEQCNFRPDICDQPIPPREDGLAHPYYVDMDCPPGYHIQNAGYVLPYVSPSPYDIRYSGAIDSDTWRIEIRWYDRFSGITQVYYPQRWMVCEL